MPATPSAQEQFKNRLAKWKALWFVVDVPLFIDEDAVRRLFDALERPEFETTARRSGETSTTGLERLDEAALEAEAGVAPFLKGKVAGKSSAKSTQSRAKTDELQQSANRSAEMQLERIISLYVRNHPTRVFWTTPDLSKLQDLDGNTVAWHDVAARIALPEPRPLIVLDLRAGTKLIPMAAELVSGKVARLYKTYADKIDEEIPTYPTDDDAQKSKAKSYWEVLDRTFNWREAMEVIEDCTADTGQINWIDYRVIARHGERIEPLHLHLVPRGRYATGTFAYQSVRRAMKYGLKMVGTLKLGEDINVLAAYEN
jgi:hypothetical protein